jgi:methyl-accepting chemotaxis protein
LLLLGVMFSTALLFVFSQDTLTSSFEQSRLQIRSTGSVILPSVILTNLITLGAVALATIAITLFVSHRIAGPLFRFEKELKQIGKGDLTKKVILRRKDQMTDMAESLNEMVSGLHDKLAVIQKDVEQLRDLASREQASVELTEALNKLDRRITESFRL